MENVSANTSLLLQCKNSISREGMRLLLQSEGFDVVVTQENFDDIGEWPARADRPLLILFDVADDDVPFAQMAVMRTLYPDAYVVILANKFDLTQVMRAFEAGVHGYIIKDIACRSLMESLRLVALGEKVLPSALACALPQKLTPYAEPARTEVNPARALSDRELETFQRMSWGEPNKVIACQLGISEATVKVHVKAILRKLHLRNRTQAVAWALNSGFDFGRRDAAVMPVPTVGAILTTTGRRAA